MKRMLLLTLMLISLMQLSADDKQYFKFYSEGNGIFTQLYYCRFGQQLKSRYFFEGHIHYALDGINQTSQIYYNGAYVADERAYRLLGDVTFFHFLVDWKRNKAEYATCNYNIPFNELSIQAIRDLLDTGKGKINIKVTGYWLDGYYDFKRDSKVEFKETLDYSLNRPIPYNLKSTFNSTKEELKLKWEHPVNNFATPYYYVFYRKEKTDSVWTQIPDAKVNAIIMNDFSWWSDYTLKMDEDDYGKDWEYSVMLAFDKLSEENYNSKVSTVTNISLPATKATDLKWEFSQPNTFQLSWECTNPLKLNRMQRVYRMPGNNNTTTEPELLFEAPMDTTLTGMINITSDQIWLNNLDTYYVDLVRDSSDLKQPTKNALSAPLHIPYAEELVATFNKKDKLITLNWTYNNPQGFPLKWHIYKREKEAGEWIMVNNTEPLATGEALNSNILLDITDEDNNKEWIYTVHSLPINDNDIIDTALIAKVEVSMLISNKLYIGIGVGILIILIVIYIFVRKRKV